MKLIHKIAVCIYLLFSTVCAVGQVAAPVGDISLRDPFEDPGMTDSNTLVEDGTEYSLRGVVRAGSKSIALIHGSNGMEYFGSVGYELGSLGTIISIEGRKGVSISNGDKTVILKMPRRN
jgi:hypothetical protein